MINRSKTWGEMTATERLAAKVGYIQYNYGPKHPLTKAAECGDIAAFRKAGTHITEMMDTVVVGIIDAADDSLAVAA